MGIWSSCHATLICQTCMDGRKAYMAKDRNEGKGFQFPLWVDKATSKKILQPVLL